MWYVSNMPKSWPSVYGFITGKFHLLCPNSANEKKTCNN